MVPRAICLCIVIQIHGQSAFVLHLINLNLETRGLKNNRAAISIGLRQTEKEKEKKRREHKMKIIIIGTKGIIAQEYDLINLLS